MLKWIYPTVNKFPKSQRWLLSDRIETTAVQILELVIEISYKDSKIHRKKIVSELHKLQILFRLCKDLSFLDFKRYEYISSLLNEMILLLDKNERGGVVQTYRNLYEKLCSFDNLNLAFKKARKNKSNFPDVRDFEYKLEKELFQLKHELETFTYKPRPLKHFTICNPKTRNISASDFRDRVVHHALCNIIEPLFESKFIYDSYANRKFKGTLAAMQRFDQFKRKVSYNGTTINQKDNNMVLGFALKCDIRKYFENVDRSVLLQIIERKIKDENIVWLIKIILENHESDIGMPLGNLTSQFFANVYLNELDYFMKHELRAKFYMRYVDDFVILHENKEVLKRFKERINEFLINELKLELHQDKSKIYPLHKGVRLLGFRCFYYFHIPKRSNIKQFEKRVEHFKEQFNNGTLDELSIWESVEGWLAYAELGNTFKMRKRIMNRTREMLTM